MLRRFGPYLIVVLIVVAWFALKEVTGFEYPSWVGWLMIAMLVLLGIGSLISPRTFSTLKPIPARVIGAFLLIVAVANAYLQFKPSLSE